MDAFLKDGHPVLRFVPGPLSLAAAGDVLWAAGGGRGEAALLRFTREGWRATPVDAHGLRAVLPLSETEAVLVGESGFVALVDGDEVTEIETDTSGCLYSVARAGDGALWISGDDGYLARLDVDEEEVRSVSSPGTERILQLVPAGPAGDLLLATATELVRRRADGTNEVMLRAIAPLTDAAFAPDGTLVVSGDGGQLYIARPSGVLQPCAGVPALDVERLLFDPRRDAFVAVGDRGWVGQVSRDGEVRELTSAAPARRLTSLVAWRDGVVYAGWEQQGPPYVFRGALYFDGPVELAPQKIAPLPLQAFGPPRTRTVGFARARVPAEPIILPIEEAKRRLPNVNWPDTVCKLVRFFDGDVHVRDTEALFASTEEFGYCVAIRGDLIVDGFLNAVAGEEGHDSVLIVQGDAWAESARFCLGIKASIVGTLEVATVVICDMGDDGGTLSAGKIRAQVLSYATYFPRPDAVIDAFCIGNIYGETSFDPDRAAEVFIPEVLEDGRLDEVAAMKRLKRGERVLREMSRDAAFDRGP